MMMVKGAVGTLTETLLSNGLDPRYARRKVRAAPPRPTRFAKAAVALGGRDLADPERAGVRRAAVRRQALIDDVNLEVGIALGTHKPPAYAPRPPPLALCFALRSLPCSGRLNPSVGRSAQG